MTEEILQLFSVALEVTTTLEDRNAATARLLEIYKSVEAYQAIFPIIADATNERAKRQFAALEIKKCLSNTWEELQEDKAVVMQQILQLLSNEQNLLIAKNIIESCKLIFEEDGKNWPDLIQYIQSETPNETQLLIKMYLVANIAKPLEDENHFTQANFPLFNALFEVARASENPEITASGCEMMGIVISFITPEQIEICQPHLEFMMQYFAAIVPQSTPDNSNYKKVQYGIADALECDELPIPAHAVVEFLMGLLQNPEVPKNLYASIFVIFQILIKFHADDLSENIDDILNILLVSGAATVDFEQESLADQDCDTVFLIGEIAGDFAGELQDPTFLKHLLALFPQGESLTPASLYSYATILYNVIDESIDEVSHDIKPIVDISLQLLQADLLSIKEISTYIIAIIGDNLHPSQDDLAKKLLENLLPYLTCPNPDMIRYAFNPIISIFTQGFLPNHMLPQFLESFTAIISAPELQPIHYMCVEAIGQMIFAVEEDILPYAQQVFEMIVQAGMITNESGTVNIFEIDTQAQSLPEIEMIKQQTVIAYGMLLRFASEAMQEQAAQILQNILSLYDPDNLEMCHSILVALGNLVIDKYPLLIEIREQIIQMVDDFVCRLAQHQIDNGEYVDDDDETESNRLDLLFGAFSDVFYLMEWIFKQYPELSPDSPTQWMATILMFMSLPRLESLQGDLQNAIRAGKYCTEVIVEKLMSMSEEERQKTDAKNNPKYFEDIIGLMQNCEYPKVVGECFSAMKYMMKKQIEIDPSYIQSTMEAAFAGIEGKLPCQQKRSLELGDSESLYGFFKAFAQNYPDQFPLEHYIEVFKVLISDEDRELFEISQYIEVTTFFYKLYQEQLKGRPLILKLMLNNIIQAYGRYATTFTDEDTEYAAFSVPPSPLESMYVILQINPQILEAQFPSILELIKTILTSEASDDKFYSATIGHAIEFLCVSKQVLGDSFNIIEWLPVILPKLPLNHMGDAKLSQHIYPCLISLLQDATVLQTFGPELLRILAQSLGRKERQFAKFKFTQELIATLITTTNQLITMGGADENVLQSFFPDDVQSYQRFISRINPTE